MCERGQAASHNEGQGDQNIRPKQLRNREVSWEGSHRSKLMSRRTERPYKVDGAGKLAPHSAAQCSVPEINGPVVQQKFTSLLRETCGPSPSATAGTAVRNDGSAGTGVSRGRSTESTEPDNKETGRTHNSGRAELGRQTRPSMVLFRKQRRRLAELPAAILVAEKSGCVIPQGLPGTAVRGPACTVVWEAGGATLPPTRLGRFMLVWRRHQ